MKSQLGKVIGLAALALSVCCVVAAGAPNERVVIRGWLSDESCASNRASSGVYTSTNLECARECVAKGKKIALIDPEGKRVLVISNQESVSKNLGDYVEVTGEMEAQGKTLHVAALKFLDKNRAMCGVPQKTAAKKN